MPMATHEKGKTHQLPENDVENGLPHIQLTSENTFLSGIKQRLLSFIFRRIWNEETNHNLVGYLNFHSISHFVFLIIFHHLSH